MTKAKNAEIQYLVIKSTLRAILMTEQPDGEDLIAERYVFAMKSDEDKHER